MNRVLVLGSSGSGKSTLARRLGDVTGLPVIHLDAEYWKPGWIETADEEFAERIQALAAGERWIMDGYHRVCLDVRLQAADTIVFLDLPRRVCLWRVVKRWLRHRGQTRPDMGPHCPEKVDLEFIRYIWSFNRSVRPGVMFAIQKYSAARATHILRTTDDLERFLASAALPFSPPH